MQDFGVRTLIEGLRVILRKRSNLDGSAGQIKCNINMPNIPPQALFHILMYFHYATDSIPILHLNELP